MLLLVVLVHEVGHDQDKLHRQAAHQHHGVDTIHSGTVDHWLLLLTLTPPPLVALGGHVHLDLVEAVSDLRHDGLHVAQVTCARLLAATHGLDAALAPGLGLLDVAHLAVDVRHEVLDVPGGADEFPLVAVLWNLDNQLPVTDL